MHKNDRKKIILPILINPNNSSLKTPNKPYINDLHLEQISTNHTYFNSDTKNNSNSSKKISFISAYYLSVFFWVLLGLGCCFLFNV